MFWVSAPFFLSVIASLHMSMKFENQNAQKRSYISIIESYDILSIDQIVRTTGNTYEIVAKDIQKLIVDGYLGNTFINWSTGEIIADESLSQT